MQIKHTDRQYEEELQDLRDRLLKMAGRVEKMIADANEALGSRDVELARATIEADNTVNRCEIETDELCLVILARRQPLASDLRFLITAFKMVTDLERIGDLAVNICERVFVLADMPEYSPHPGISEMAGLTQAMLHDAVDAFVAGDADLAQQVIERDDQVDELYRRVFRELLGQIRGDEDYVESGIRFQSVAKLLERMADHCTNLAEQVIFLVRGQEVRHKGKLGKQ
jgi:phosphate transport system protein